MIANIKSPRRAVDLVRVVSSLRGSPERTSPRSSSHRFVEFEFTIPCDQRHRRQQTGPHFGNLSTLISYHRERFLQQRLSTKTWRWLRQSLIRTRWYYSIGLPCFKSRRIQMRTRTTSRWALYCSMDALRSCIDFVVKAKNCGQILHLETPKNSSDAVVLDRCRA